MSSRNHDYRKGARVLNTNKSSFMLSVSYFDYILRCYWGFSVEVMAWGQWPTKYSVLHIQETRPVWLERVWIMRGCMDIWEEAFKV